MGPRARALRTAPRRARAARSQGHARPAVLPEAARDRRMRALGGREGRAREKERAQPLLHRTHTPPPTLARSTGAAPHAQPTTPMRPADAQGKRSSASPQGAAGVRGGEGVARPHARAQQGRTQQPATPKFAPSFPTRSHRPIALARSQLTAVWTSSSSYLVALAATERRPVALAATAFFMQRAIVVFFLAFGRRRGCTKKGCPFFGWVCVRADLGKVERGGNRGRRGGAELRWWRGGAREREARAWAARDPARLSLALSPRRALRALAHAHALLSTPRWPNLAIGGQCSASTGPPGVEMGAERGEGDRGAKRDATAATAALSFAPRWRGNDGETPLSTRGVLRQPPSRPLRQRSSVRATTT